MNEELQSRLTKYLDYLESAASTGADAVSAATPVVCQEILLWNVVFPFLFVAPVLAFAILSQKTKNSFEQILKNRRNNGYYSSSDDGDRAFHAWVSGFFWLAFSVSLFAATCFASRSYLTPHLVIIDAVKSVIRQ